LTSNATHYCVDGNSLQIRNREEWFLKTSHEERPALIKKQADHPMNQGTVSSYTGIPLELE